MAARTGGWNDPSGHRGRRLQTLLFVLALVVLGVATGVGHVVVRDQERDRAADDAAEVADAAATSTATLVARTGDALAGASAILGEGGIDLAAFRRFAADVVAGGTTEAVLLLTVVQDEDRQAFEGTVRPITTGNGTDPPSASVYYPVTDVFPEPQTDIRGVDFLSDADRGPAMQLAADELTTVVSDPVDLTTGEPGVLVIRPIVPAQAAAPVGFVAAPLSVEKVVDSLVAALPPRTQVAITDGGQELAVSGHPDGEDAAQMEVDLPGQHWVVTAEPAEDDRPDLAVLVLGAGSAAWLALLMIFVVTVRHQRRLRGTNRSLAVAEARSRTLERLASRLSRSLSGAEVAGAVLEGLHGLTGAIGGAVAVRSADGDQLALVLASGYTPAQEERLSRVPLVPGGILHEVLTSGEAAYVPSPLGWRDDETLARFADIGMSTAVVPLMGDEDAHAVLVVSQPSVRRFGPDERSLLETIGALAGRALARSLRYDVEHATSLAFQRASLPAVLPTTEGLAVAARYRPATSSSSIGGDWYDVIALPGGRVAVVVGDVVGHGVTAAAVMGHLRSAVRVLAGALSQPDALLRSLTAEVASIPNALGATMAYGIVDPIAGTFEFLLAGHPPPLLLRADGRSAILDVAPWPPLGVTPADEPAVPAVALRPGDTVVLYTDGVIERRGESLAVGLERLLAAGQDLGDLVPDDLCDALLEAIVPSDDQADDVAIVVIRLLSTPAIAIDVTDGSRSGEPVDGGAEAGGPVGPRPL